MNQIIPWLPLPDLPQTPCGIRVEGGPEQVTVRAVYSFYEGCRDLLIDFQAEVFGCFSEMATLQAEPSPNYPFLSRPEFSRYMWPLMEVHNSAWLASYRDAFWADETYRHFRIVSDDGSFDALTCREPFARWTDASG